MWEAVPRLIGSLQITRFAYSMCVVRHDRGNPVSGCVPNLAVISQAFRPRKSVRWDLDPILMSMRCDSDASVMHAQCDRTRNGIISEPVCSIETPLMPPFCFHPEHQHRKAA